MGRCMVCLGVLTVSLMACSAGVIGMAACMLAITEKQQSWTWVVTKFTVCTYQVQLTGVPAVVECDMAATAGPYTDAKYTL